MTATLVRASALSTNCARCFARPGDPCLSVRRPRRGQPKAWVHNVRKRAGQ